MAEAGRDRPGMALDCHDQSRPNAHSLAVELGGRQSPYAGGAVVGSREDAPAIERKCDSPERAFVTVEGQKVAAAFRVPEVQTAIGTHPRDAGAVG